jgi:hypothetical protein
MTMDECTELYGDLAIIIHQKFWKSHPLFIYPDILTQYNILATMTKEKQLDKFKYCTLTWHSKDGTAWDQEVRPRMTQLLIQILMKRTTAATLLAEDLGLMHPFLKARFMIDKSKFDNLTHFLNEPIYGKFK